MANQLSENGAGSNGQGQGPSPLQAAIARAVKNNSAATPTLTAAAREVLERLCTEYASELKAGKITKEILRMIVAEETGVEIEKLT